MQYSVRIGFFFGHILIDSLFTVVKLRLVVHQVLVFLFTEPIHLEIEVKCADWDCCRLIVGKMQLSQIWMLQGLFYSYPLVRIVDEHFFQKINALIRYVGE